MYNRFPYGSFLPAAAGVDLVLRTYITDQYSESECVVVGPHGEVVRILTVSLCQTRQVALYCLVRSALDFWPLFFLHFFFVISDRSPQQKIRFLIEIQKIKPKNYSTKHRKVNNKIILI